MRHAATVLVVLAAAGLTAGCGSATPAPRTTTTPSAAVTAFDAPQAAHAAFARGQLIAASHDMAPLTSALGQARRRRGRAAWRAAWIQYLRAGVTYGSPAGLDEALDGTLANGGEVTGYHFIEQALWQNGDLPSMLATATTMSTQLIALRRAVADVRLTPLAYAQRPQELLHDARYNELTGQAVQWSGDGVDGVAGDTAAAEEILGTLYPLLRRRGGDPAPIIAAMAAVDAQLRTIRRQFGHTRYPTLGKLMPAERARLATVLQAALTATQSLPRQLHAASAV